MQRRAGHGLAVGAGLIALGVVALLEGTIDGFPNVWEMAPAIAAVYLAVRTVSYSSAGSRPWLLLIVAALVLWQVAIIADLALDGNLIWPLLIIVVGVTVLVKALRRRQGNGDDAAAIFGHIQRRVSGPLPEPLPVSALFGSCEFDLREAELGHSPGQVDASATFGSIELRVPRDWNVDTAGVTATFGSVTEKDSPSGAQRELQISGSVLFGSIEIRR